MGGAKLKTYDYGVLGLFVLTIIGVSLSWYTASFDLMGQSVSEGASGWNRTVGVLAFLAALAAAVLVLVKLLVPATSRLPGWWREGLFVMILGGLVAVFALIGLDKPGDLSAAEQLGLNIGYGAGLFITLIAGLALVACGYMLFQDKSRAPSQAAWVPPAGPGAPGPTAYGPPPAQGARFCNTCGAQLDPGSAFCRSCGRPV